MKTTTIFPLLIYFLLISKPIFTQVEVKEIINNDKISGMAPFCSDTGIEFKNSLYHENTSVVKKAPKNINYGCLQQRPYPSWFYIKIDASGKLALTIEQENKSKTPIDVDFITWGPYTKKDIIDIKKNNKQEELLKEHKIIDCSFEKDAIEFLTVPKAKKGEYYIILITNYKKEAGTIKMTSTPSKDNTARASTDCSIVSLLGEDQILCEGTQYRLDATSYGEKTLTYQWFLDKGNGDVAIKGKTNPILIIKDNISGTYKVKISDGKNTWQDTITIEYLPKIVTTQIKNVIECIPSNQKSYTFDLSSIVTQKILKKQKTTDVNVSYFTSHENAQSNLNIIPNAKIKVMVNKQQKIYARIYHNRLAHQCYSITSFVISPTQKPKINTPTSYYICDDMKSGSNTDGISDGIILANKDAEILGNLSPKKYTISYHSSLNGAKSEENIDLIDKNTPYTNKTPFKEPVYVKVKSNDSNCVNNEVLVTIEVKPIPDFEDNSLLNSIITIDETNNKRNENYSIKVNHKNISNYKFALIDSNGEQTSFQKEPVFNNLEGGIYTVIIRDDYDCGTTQKQVVLVKAPSFFTPNNDGYNDTWNIQGINNKFFLKAEITICNRFGRVLIKRKITKNWGWDGHYNGKILPSNDYWFHLVLTDQSNNVYSSYGHFSLLKK